MSLKYNTLREHLRKSLQSDEQLTYTIENYEMAMSNRFKLTLISGGEDKTTSLNLVYLSGDMHYLEHNTKTVLVTLDWITSSILSFMRKTPKGISNKLEQVRNDIYNHQRLLSSHEFILSPATESIPLDSIRNWTPDPDDYALVVPDCITAYRYALFNAIINVLFFKKNQDIYLKTIYEIFETFRDKKYDNNTCYPRSAGAYYYYLFRNIGNITPVSYRPIIDIVESVRKANKLKEEHLGILFGLLDFTLHELLIVAFTDGDNGIRKPKDWLGVMQKFLGTDLMRNVEV